MLEDDEADNKEWLYREGVIEEHETLRTTCRWGGRGKSGSEPVEYKTIDKLDDSHLFNIYMTQGFLPSEYKDMLFTEMFYRLREARNDVGVL